jgi:hypothetical protein
MTQMPMSSNHAQIREYLIDRVSDLAGRPVPRKAAMAWLETMAALIAAGILAIIVRLTVK